MKRKDGMHRLSLGRQEEDLVSGIRQCPGSRSEHPPQASGTLLSRVQRVLQSPVGLHRFSGMAMGPGGASQAGLTATCTSKVSKRHCARPCCDGFCTLKKSLQSQPGRHKSQRLCAAAADMTYGPITMATGAQPAQAQKHCSRLTGL